MPQGPETSIRAARKNVIYFLLSFNNLEFLLTLTKSQDQSGVCKAQPVSAISAQSTPPDVQKMFGVLQDMQAQIATLQASTVRVTTDLLSNPNTTSFKSLTDQIQAKESTIKSLFKTLESLAPDEAFTSFPRLPTELRQMSFEAAVSAPEIFEIGCSSNLLKTGLLIHNGSLPALLHVNQESRAISLKRYDTIIEGRFGFATSHRSFPTGTGYTNKFGGRFGPSKDIIFIPWEKDHHHLHDGVRTSGKGSFWSRQAKLSLQYLALDWRVFTGGQTRTYSSSLTLTGFSNLKVLTIVIHEVHGENPGWKDVCTESWKVRKNGPLEFIDNNGGQFVLDLTAEVQEYLVNEKARAKREQGIEWNVPKVEIKYLTRGGKKCCHKRVHRP